MAPRVKPAPYGCPVHLVPMVQERDGRYRCPELVPGVFGGGKARLQCREYAPLVPPVGDESAPGSEDGNGGES